MDIKSLIKTFSKHETHAIKDRQKMMRDFIKNYPGEKIPEHIKEDFNLPAALRLMCEEILKLKEMLKRGVKK